jgi:hypothetical protein
VDLLKAIASSPNITTDDHFDLKTLGNFSGDYASSFAGYSAGVTKQLYLHALRAFKGLRADNSALHPF